MKPTEVLRHEGWLAIRSSVELPFKFTPEERPVCYFLVTPDMRVYRYGLRCREEDVDLEDTEQRVRDYIHCLNAKISAGEVMSSPEMDV